MDRIGNVGYKIFHPLEEWIRFFLCSLWHKPIPPLANHRWSEHYYYAVVFVLLHGGGVVGDMTVCAESLDLMPEDSGFFPGFP